MISLDIPLAPLTKKHYPTAMATALSGELSRRRLGTQSGDMRREARRLERGGYDRAAGAMALAASEQRLTEGSAITHAGASLARRNASMSLNKGLMAQQRASVLGGREDPAETTAATGDQLAKRKGLYERMRGGVTPEMRTEATGLGITDSGFAQASASAAKNPLKPAAATAPVGGAAAAPSYDSDNNGIPNSLQRLAATPAPAAPAAPREGRIDGMPASKAIAGVPKPAQFGSNYATANLEKLGLSGAIADYRRREAEAAKPPEPGNMAELKARDAGVPATPTIGPLQTALDESRARREGYAADAVAAKGLTAKLNSAPTPSLDTAFPKTPNAPTPAPAAGATPAPPPFTPVAGRRAGAVDYMKENSVALQDARIKREKAEAEKARATRAAQITTARSLPRITSRSY